MSLSLMRATLAELADGLRNFQNELKTIKIRIESTLGWLTRWDDSVQIIHHRQRMAAHAALTASGSNWTPVPLPDEPQK
jgi:hypothetical protein